MNKDNISGNQIVWYLMGMFLSVIVIGGGAWANSINQKVEKIASLEVNIGYMQRDIRDIKDILREYVNSLTPVLTQKLKGGGL